MFTELLKEARGWLADCGRARKDDTDLIVAHLIHANFDGGWPNFILSDPDYTTADFPFIWLAMVSRWGWKTANYLLPSDD